MKVRSLFISIIVFISVFNIQAQQQKEVELNSFNQVKFEGSATWVLIPSSEEKVVIESENADVFNYINIHQTGDIITINTLDKNKNITKLFKLVTINVYFKSLKSVSLSGIGSVKTKDKFNAENLTATLRGTGNMYLIVDCDKFKGNMYGTGLLSISGTSNKSEIAVEGVGGFDGFDFITNNMSATVSGVGGASVFATNVLTATINGIGSIKFKGNPETRNFNTNGIGSIKKSED